MTTIVLVESGAKCSKIQTWLREELGEHIICMPTFGHICELPSLDKLKISATEIIPTFSIIPSKKKQLAAIRKQVAAASRLILATDNDREGESIAWHICRLCKQSVDTTPRIIFNEITRESVVYAVRHPIRIRMNIVHSQITRQIIDLLIGFRVSPLLWNNIKSRVPLSAGRCQTPALRLIYESSLASTAPTIQYKLAGYFTSYNIKFTTDCFPLDVIRRYLSSRPVFMLTCGSPSSHFIRPPTPFDTSSLLQCATRTLRLSSKEVMECCQTLYEAGYITYLRTDSTSYCEEFASVIQKWIATQYGQAYVSSSIPIQTNQSAHEAIRVTQLQQRDVTHLEGDSISSVYRLIYRNTVESCMAPAFEYHVTATISTVEPYDEANIIFSHTAHYLQFDGWKHYARSDVEPLPSSIYTYLTSPLYDRSKSVEWTLIETEIHAQQSALYTESSLLSKLKQIGIGRPSTFSGIIETLYERNYINCETVEGTKLPIQHLALFATSHVVREETIARQFGKEVNKLIIQPIGIQVIRYLLSHCLELFEYEYTKQMEEQLDLIASGTANYQTIALSCSAHIENCVHPTGMQDENEEKEGGEVEPQPSSQLKDCVPYVIDTAHRLIYGKYGFVVMITKKGTKTPSFQSVRNVDDISPDDLINHKYKLVKHRDNTCSFVYTE